MRTILVAYDLNNPGQKYAELAESIKSLGAAWWHGLDSTWMVRTESDPVAVRDHLAKNLDSGDKLLVIDVTGDAGAWRGFSGKTNDWLKETWK